MTNTEMVEAGLARAESACASRALADLLMAEAVLMGLLDHAARQDASDETWVRAALSSVSQLVREARS